MANILRTNCNSQSKGIFIDGISYQYMTGTFPGFNNKRIPLTVRYTYEVRSNNWGKGANPASVGGYYGCKTSYSSLNPTGAEVNGTATAIVSLINYYGSFSALKALNSVRTGTVIRWLEPLS